MGRERRRGPQRSAVSRAYYAMFCTARDKLDEANKYNPPECGSEHQYVWASYRQEAAVRQIGVLGNRLRRYRNRADYDNLILDLPDVVETALDDAEELKGYLENLTI